MTVMVQNRERTGDPARAARVGWWMRPGQALDVRIALFDQNGLARMMTKGLR